MRTKKSVFSVAVAVFVCVVVVWFCTLIQGGETTYELEHEIRVPEYRTDAARAIDAYERLMDRYMSLTERNLVGVSTDVRATVRKLDSIDVKLADISARMARIERHLGIEAPKKPVPKISRSKTGGQGDKDSAEGSKDVSDNVKKGDRYYDSPQR